MTAYVTQKPRGHVAYGSTLRRGFPEINSSLAGSPAIDLRPTRLERICRLVREGVC